MAVNKVVINRDGAPEVLMDLTGDTVTADSLVVGYTAHDKKGERVTGANPYAKAETDATVNAQTNLITQLKDAIAENVSKTTAEVDTQTDLIQQIKTALEGKAGGGGGTVLPTLTNPGTASDLAEGKQLIDADGKVVEGALRVQEGDFHWEYDAISVGDGYIAPFFYLSNDLMLKGGANIYVDISMNEFGDAKPEDVAQGKVFTSSDGLKRTGTAAIGGGSVVKSGTTTSRTVNTGLSNVDQFFIYKESLTSTGLIHLHYTKEATSRMYASAWSTNNYGTKTITNGTGGVTVSGGTVTISATQATQGALTSNVTYKWIAVGTE